jgi:hypothetical protein
MPPQPTEPVRKTGAAEPVFPAFTNARGSENWMAEKRQCFLLMQADKLTAVVDTNMKLAMPHYTFQSCTHDLFVHPNTPKAPHGLFLEMRNNKTLKVTK